MTARTDHAALLERISSLLAESGTRDPSLYLARVEETLTTGYARALELEAEAWRLERRLGELAARGEAGRAEELAKLARSASATAGGLAELRARLASLRARASALRAA